jgi:DNA-binding SARP family transcriptional activator
MATAGDRKAPATGQAARRFGSVFASPPDGADRFQVSLLGGFRFSVRSDAFLVLPGSSKRLLAFLSLHDRAVARATVAGTLWPAVPEHRAHASLRSALARLDRVARRAVAVTPVSLRLADGVAVDVRHSQALAHRILDRNALVSEADLDRAAVHALSSDLLPDWFEDWVVIEAEDWRQLRLRALEALVGRLIAAGRTREAADAARAAVMAEPLRESARAALIRVQLAERNRAAAVEEFLGYRALLHSELGLEPTPRLHRLIDANRP